MTDHKTILFVDATPDYAVPGEIIECVSKAFGYRVERHTFQNRELLEAFITESKSFDILYIGAHGNKHGVALETADGETTDFLRWSELGLMVCSADGLQPNSSVFLGCCEGGFKRASLVMMTRCHRINSVAGLPCKLRSPAAGLVFHTYLYHKALMSDAPSTESAITAANGDLFKIFLREEMDEEIGSFTQFCYNLYLTPDEYHEECTKDDTMDEWLRYCEIHEIPHIERQIATAAE